MTGQVDGETTAEWSPSSACGDRLSGASVCR